MTCGTPLDVSNAPAAQRMKAQIALRISQGKTKDQIKDEFVREFGEQVLATPRKSGFGLVAWLLPSLAVVAGLCAIPFVTRAWAKRRPATTSPDAAAERRGCRSTAARARRVRGLSPWVAASWWGPPRGPTPSSSRRAGTHPTSRTTPRAACATTPSSSRWSRSTRRSTRCRPSRPSPRGPSAPRRSFASTSKPTRSSPGIPATRRVCPPRSARSRPNSTPRVVSASPAVNCATRSSTRCSNPAARSATSSARSWCSFRRS